jgi:hypothetical protein
MAVLCLTEEKYLANKICFCILNSRFKFDSFVHTLGVHLEGPQGDTRLGAHLIRATVNLNSNVTKRNDNCSKHHNHFSNEKISRLQNGLAFLEQLQYVWWNVYRHSGVRRQLDGLVKDEALVDWTRWLIRHRVAVQFNRTTFFG